MKLIKESDTYYLDEKGKRVTVSPSEINLFRQMTPLGRKIILRKRALDIMAADPENPQASFLLSLAKLPAYEWSFLVPD